MSVSATAEFVPVWDLTGLVPAPGSTEFQAFWDQYAKRLSQLAQSSDQLPMLTDSLSWDAWLAEWIAVDTTGTDLRAYLDCLCAAEAENKSYQKLETSLAALGPLREQVFTNLELALQAADDATFEGWINASQYRQSLQFALRLRRQMSRLRLLRTEEMLAARLAVDGFQGWSRLYDRLSGRLKVTLTEHGVTRESSVGQVPFDVADRTIRENRYHVTDAAWKTIAEPCADALNHLAGWRLNLIERLKLPDHLTSPLILNRMDGVTLQTMWDTISARKGMLVEFLQLKAELLGLKKLTWYDLPAPLPEIVGTAAASRISYQDGCELIIDSFKAFSPELGEFARMSCAERWIEAENRGGKRQGGFCTTLPTAKQSRIFMTYTESFDGLSTLAHELGHAYHSWVLRDELLPLTDYPMNLAETASTFCEAILGDARLARAGSLYERLSVLEGMLGDAVAFLMNIHARFLFEDRMYGQRKQGELSTEELGALMLDAQREAYCNALADDGYHERFWVSKLHFYMSGVPFYNFPYTFGYLLSLGLFRVGQQCTSDFPRRYRKFLWDTGRATAEDAVQNNFGYNLRTPELWNLSLDVIEDRVRQFRELAAEWRAHLKR